MKKIWQKFQNLSKRSLKGFTLIELLVVITIIGILSTVVVLNVQDSRAKARNAKRKSDLNTIASALEAYYADFNGYPFGEGFVRADGAGFAIYRNVALSTNSYVSHNCSAFTDDPMDDHDMFDLCSRGGNWLWELAFRGYIDTAPTEPFNVGGEVFDYEFIDNAIAPEPGLFYIYVNDEPGNWTATHGVGPNCYQGDAMLFGHGQRYRLAASLERPDIDRDFITDGGDWESIVTALNFEGLNLGGIRFGMFYEVFSAGAIGWPDPGWTGTGHLFTPDTLSADAADPNDPLCY